jgi:hypothetical protein
MYKKCVVVPTQKCVFKVNGLASLGMCSGIKNFVSVQISVEPLRITEILVLSAFLLYSSDSCHSVWPC